MSGLAFHSKRFIRAINLRQPRHHWQQETPRPIGTMMTGTAAATLDDLRVAALDEIRPEQAERVARRIVGDEKPEGPPAVEVAAFGSFI